MKINRMRPLVRKLIPPPAKFIPRPNNDNVVHIKNWEGDFTDEMFWKRINENNNVNEELVKKVNENKIALVTLTNDDYMKYTLPMLVSFLLNNRWFEGDFVIIYDDELLKLSEENKEKLKDLYENTIFHKVVKSEYDDLIEKYKPKMGSQRWQCVFYKYEIFKMEEYDKILLLDSDMIINNTLIDVFEKDVDFGSVYDVGASRDKPSDYINAGFIYISTKNTISMNLYEKIYDFTSKNGPYVFPEQDALNYFFNNNKYLFDESYNMHTALKNITPNSKIIHYTNKIENCHGFEKSIFNTYTKMYNFLISFKSKIDIVITYVDPTDKKWLTKHNKLFPNDIIDEDRYNFNPFFNYLFRGIERYAKWVNNVYLVVESESQIPKWLVKDNVKIVYHKDIIPKKYLPTYNSICIASFFHKIKGLSDHFLYLNDDTMIVNNVNEFDFFGIKNGKIYPKSTYIASKKRDTFFAKQLDNSIKLLKTTIPIKNEAWVNPFHNIRGYLKEDFVFIYNTFEKQILELNTSKKRENYNLGQMISMYMYLSGNYIQSTLKENAIYNIQSNSDIDILKNILNNEPLLCLNQVDKKFNDEILDILENKFPQKSKYEK